MEDKEKKIEEKKLEWQKILEMGRLAGFDEGAVTKIAKAMIETDRFSKMCERIYLRQKEHIAEKVVELSHANGNINEQAEAQLADLIQNFVIEYAVSIVASFAANQGLRQDFVEETLAPRFIRALKGDDDFEISGFHSFTNGKPDTPQE